MAKGSSRYGVRNSLPANREAWYRRRPSTAETTTPDRHELLPQIAIGRFLLSKAEATRDPASLQNPLVDTAVLFQSMNRKRGTSVEPRKLMLTYQTPEQFHARVAMRAESHGFSNKTVRHQRDQMRRLKEEIGDYFAEQERSDASEVNARLVRLAVEERQKEKDAYEAFYRERGQELPDDMYEFLEDEPVYIEDPGSHDQTGVASDGFTFRSRFFYDGLIAGLRVRQIDDMNAGRFQQDIDLINDAFRECDLIGGKLGPIQAEDIVVHVPLFIADTPELAEAIHPPIVPMDRVPFQKLGIHQI